MSENRIESWVREVAAETDVGRDESGLGCLSQECIDLLVHLEALLDSNKDDSIIRELVSISIIDPKEAENNTILHEIIVTLVQATTRARVQRVIKIIPAWGKTGRVTEYRTTTFKNYLRKKLESVKSWGNYGGTKDNFFKNLDQAGLEKALQSTIIQIEQYLTSSTPSTASPTSPA